MSFARKLGRFAAKASIGAGTIVVRVATDVALGLKDGSTETVANFKEGFATAKREIQAKPPCETEPSP